VHLRGVISVYSIVKERRSFQRQASQCVSQLSKLTPRQRLKLSLSPRSFARRGIVKAGCTINRRGSVRKLLAQFASEDCR
jgi:hypothetical protein